MRKQWYRQKIGERKWEPIEVNDRSPLAAEGKRMQPGEQYDDGSFNLYRYELVED